MNHSAPLLTLHNLACERDERVLFCGVNLSFNAGETVQILGPNGAGKTSLLRILVQINRDYEGEIHYAGAPVQDRAWEFAQDCLYLGHLPGVKKALTPLENLQWFCAQMAIRGEPLDALAQVGLAGYEDTPCQLLSAGQQRRVALARLYLSAARIWVLDEPFTAIDKRGVEALEALIAQHCSEGGLVVLSSHQDLRLQPLRLVNLLDYQPQARAAEQRGELLQ